MSDVAPKPGVEVEITRADLGFLTWRLMIFNRTIWIIGTSLALAILWSLSKGGKLPASALEGLILLALLTSCILAWVLVWAVLGTLFGVLTASTRNGVLGRHRYEISEEGLHESAIANESLVHWQGIHAVKLMKSYLLVFQTPALVHVLPRRCFRREEDFVFFAATLRERTREATGKSS